MDLKSALGRPDTDGEDTSRVAEEIETLSSVRVFERSVTVADNTLYFCGRRDDDLLGVLTQDQAQLEGFTGERSVIALGGEEFTLLLGPKSAANAARLREKLPHLSPRPLGLEKSIGCGDRLGFATPGHAEALRHFGRDRAVMSFIPAQQSMRENARTGRTPQQVLDDATWGVFRAGWRHGFGADADHLKSEADIDLCAAAGYTFFTVDPGEHVDNVAESATGASLRAKLDALPWEGLETSYQDAKVRYLGRPFDLGDRAVTFDEAALATALVKYGRAVHHVVKMYRHLAERMGARPFELEVSVDETESVTSLAEHVYIAAELSRLGVKWVSLAPRYVGRFEKGVDYIGDLDALKENFAGHFAVSQRFGPYKLSLHSGSDKFSAYVAAREVAGELVHLKTAGTSYLEALRALGTVAPEWLRAVYEFALERYETDRASYHVSAEIERAPAPGSLRDGDLPALLDHFDARQILHVTFGSVLGAEELAEPVIKTLRAREDVYHETLKSHFIKHIEPFVG